VPPTGRRPTYCSLKRSWVPHVPVFAPGFFDFAFCRESKPRQSRVNLHQTTLPSFAGMTGTRDVFYLLWIPQRG
jgi:hypothetical protein